MAFSFFLHKCAALTKVKRNVLVLVLIQAIIFFIGVIFLNVFLLIGIMFGILLTMAVILLLWNMRHPSPHKLVSPALVVTIVILTFGTVIFIKGYTATTIPRGDTFIQETSALALGNIERFDNSTYMQSLMSSGSFYSPYNDLFNFSTFYYLQISPKLLAGSTVMIHVDFLVNVDCSTTAFNFTQGTSLYLSDKVNGSSTTVDGSMTAGPSVTFSFNSQPYTENVWIGSVNSPIYTVTDPSTDFIWFNMQGSMTGSSTHLITAFNTTIWANGTARPNQYVSDDGLVVEGISPSSNEAELTEWVLIGTTILTIWLMALFASMITGKMDLVMIVVLVLLVFSILAMLVIIGAQLDPNDSNNDYYTKCPSSWGDFWVVFCGAMFYLAIAIGVLKWIIAVGIFVAICLVITIFYAKSQMH